MTSVAAERRVLPRGWLDLFKQVLIWFGFVLAYQVVRGIADRSPAVAFENGRDVIDIERRVTGLWELSFQSWTESYELLGRLTSWTYWLSQFAVVGLALLWVYFRRYDHFIKFRNVLMLANVIGLFGYVLLPTAPPRMFPEVGFVDTLASMGTPNHGPRRAGVEPLRGDAEPARRRRAHRRNHARDPRPTDLAEGPLAALADVGLVLGDGDRQPLLAGHRGRHRRRTPRRAGHSPARGRASPGPRGLRMGNAPISRARMRDLTRLGRSRTVRRPATGRRPVRALLAAESSPRPYGHRQRLAAAPQSGQLAPRTCDLGASPI
jgi:hypothetical protein